MTVRVLLSVLVCAAASACVRGADAAAPVEEKKLTPKEALKARMRAEGKKQAPTAAAKGSAAPTPTSDSSVAAADPNGGNVSKKETGTKSETPPAPPTMLPQVDVRSSRITELDQQVAKQEREIAKEKENTKPTEVDRALNDTKVSKLLSIFGGESSQHRAGIAQERVSLMEAEKDILEAMKVARTKEEKAELQKQLDELKAYRRELEKSLR